MDSLNSLKEGKEKKKKKKEEEEKELSELMIYLGIEPDKSGKLKMSPVWQKGLYYKLNWVTGHAPISLEH